MDSAARTFAFLRTLTSDGADAPAFLQTPQARRAIRDAVLFSAGAAALFAALYLVIGPAQFVPPNLASAVVLAVIAADGGRHPIRQVYAAVAVALGLFGAELTLVGHIDNGITVWFIVPNVAVMLLGMRRAATLCAIGTVVELVVVSFAASTGLIRGVAEVQNPDLVMVLSVIGILCVCGVMALFGYNSRMRLLAEVQRQNVALGAALDESREARNEALEAVRAKDRFFANLTHEIRTPLAGIAGSAELLAQGELPWEERHLADALLSSTRSLATLVNAMLDHARLAAGHAHVDLAPVSLREVADELTHLFTRLAEAQALRLHVTVEDDVPALVVTDGMRLRQVLVNLVSNALKFTEQGEVRVVLGWQPDGEPRSGTVVATVADTGPGIPPDLRERVFEPFIQGDASIRRSHAGTGLGLAIARQIVDLLGGTIGLTSEMAVGTAFTVRVPAMAVDARMRAPMPEMPPQAMGAGTPETAFPSTRATATSAELGLTGLRVLLVEDNQTNRTVATAMLRRSGIDVVPAVNGDEAIALAASADVDLVLMDLQMPVLDGIEASRRIRAAEHERNTPRLPILAMTGNAPEDYAEVCAAAGMDGFVTKPVTLGELRSVLVETLARRDARAGSGAQAGAETGA